MQPFDYVNPKAKLFVIRHYARRTNKLEAIMLGVEANALSD